MEGISAYLGFSDSALHVLPQMAKLDGAFDYCTFYYNIIDLLQANQDWFQGLQQYWNMYGLIIL